MSFGLYELRWFLKGELPDTVERWFGKERDGQHKPKMEKRTDSYLLLQNAEYLGIKLREGKLELKWRKKSKEFSVLNGKITGYLEDWEKFSHKDAEFEDEVSQSIKKTGKNPWLLTIKERKQLKFELEEEDFKAIGYDQNSNSWDRKSDLGFLIELTKLSLKGEPWWSVGFDIFGKDMQELILNKATEWILKDFQTSLCKENSYGYPKWITI